MKEISFAHRVAIVTGAGSGLGRLYALELAKRGAKVVVNDIGGARDGSGGASRTAAEGVVGEIASLGGTAVANYDSVATVEGGQAIVDCAVEAFGKVDILINNAGIIRDKTLVKMDAADWERVMAVHLAGAYNVTRPAFIQMRENTFGRIIFTTSAAGLYGNFGQANYSAAKMGLIGFMNSLKLEGEKYRITANAVAPVAATRLTEDIFPEALLGKFKAESVAPLVLWLCSDECVVSGSIYNAGTGFYCRAAVVTGPGVSLGDENSPPTPEQIGVNFQAISSLDGAVEWPSATHALGAMLGTKGGG
jgi:NAD(P)-dependent dehydrogenase (short-subunit alcohol dehydrogenase family)